MTKSSVAKNNRWLMFTYKGRPRIVRTYHWSGDFLKAIQIAGMSDSGKVGPKRFNKDLIENMVEFSVVANEDGLVGVSQSTPYTAMRDKAEASE